MDTSNRIYTNHLSQDLFGQIGHLKRAFLHIGPNGKSAGIADIVFQSGQDAEKARNTYNNVELDGKFGFVKKNMNLLKLMYYDIRSPYAYQQCIYYFCSFFCTFQ